MTQSIIYAFVYNSSIFESASETISLHYSKEGAQNAKKEHKKKIKKHFNETISNNNPYGFKYTDNKYWGVKPIAILP